METIRQKTSFAGFTGTGLKVLALVLMVLDHIHYFFGFTGLIPEWFSMAGRLAAPIFLFCVVEGFSHTRSRGRYFLRIAAVAIPMGALRFFMQYGGFFNRPDGFYPRNGIFTDFMVLLVIWQGIDWLCARRFLPGLAALLGALLWPYGSALLFNAVPGIETFLGFSCYTFLPSWMFGEGGIVTLVSGILLYVFRKRRGLQLAAWGTFVFLYDFVFIGYMVVRGGESFTTLFTQYYEWMELLAVVPLALYNGRRGRGLKALFYVFYPAHVYILYALSWALYLVIH